MNLEAQSNYMSNIILYYLFVQVQDLRMQFATKTDTDDQILAVVNSKVDEWKVRGSIKQ